MVVGISVGVPLPGLIIEGPMSDWTFNIGPGGMRKQIIPPISEVLSGINLVRNIRQPGQPPAPFQDGMPDPFGDAEDESGGQNFTPSQNFRDLRNRTQRNGKQAFQGAGR